MSDTSSKDWAPPQKIEELYEKANNGSGHTWTAINAPTGCNNNGS